MAPPDQKLYFVRKPELARLVVEALAGEKIQVTDSIIDMHIAGYGPVQIKRALGEEGPWTGIKRYTDEWDSSHKWFSTWVDRIEKQVSKSGYVVSPFGRRVWTRDGAAGRRFLVASTVSDIWKQVALRAKQVYVIFPDGLALLEPLSLKLELGEISEGLVLEFKSKGRTK